MKRFKIFRDVLRQSGAGKIWTAFLIQFFVTAGIIWLREPDIRSYGDALWYCYAVVTTIGFGDIVVQSLLSRILSVLLSINAVIVIAIITGVIVNYYMQVSELRRKGTLAAFVDKLEHLPELSHEELQELSEKVKEFTKNT